MLSFIAIVLVLGLLIFFHELGHFALAKLFGVGVKTFSLGFGPSIVSFSYGSTTYKLGLIPLGGYVNMVGEHDIDEMPEGFTEDQNFAHKPAYKRMLIVAAGPVFNFLLAWLIYWALFWSQGQMEILPIVGDVNPDSPAAVAGLQPDDEITAIDGKPIKYWRELAASIKESGGTELTLTIERGPEENPQTLETTVTPKVSTTKNIFGEEIRTPLIGIAASGETMNIPLQGGSAFVEGFRQTVDIIKFTVQGIVKLIERIVPLDTVGGPIFIAQMVGEQAKQGFSNVLALTALISINLGLLNLLPIPVLDGGHILFYTLETIMRRPVNRKVQEITTRFGLLLIITLMLLALYNDILRLIKGTGPL